MKDKLPFFRKWNKWKSRSWIDIIFEKLFGPKESKYPIAPPDDTWKSAPERITIPAGSTEIIFWTRGLKHTLMKNCKNKWEYGMLYIVGQGFKRIALYYCGGKNRGGRIIFGGYGNEKAFDMKNDAIFGPVRWRVVFKDGKGNIYMQKLDQEEIPLIGDGIAFSGIPDTVIAGGWIDHKQNMKGEWAGLEIK